MASCPSRKTCGSGGDRFSGRFLWGGSPPAVRWQEGSHQLAELVEQARRVHPGAQRRVSAGGWALCARSALQVTSKRLLLSHPSFIWNCRISALVLKEWRQRTFSFFVMVAVVLPQERGE